MHKIICDGPGPHDPVDGILGTTDRADANGMRCISPACAMPEIQQPLDAAGALATLLVTKGVLDLDEAADAVKLDSQDLVDEAHAWDVAAAALELPVTKQG